MARPLGALEDALAVALPSDAIILAQGLHPFTGVVTVPNLQIIGACAAGVVIEGSGQAPALSLLDQVHLEGLTVRGHGAPALLVGATVDLTAVHLAADGVGPALQVEPGAQVTGHDVRVVAEGPALRSQGSVALTGAELFSHGPVAVEALRGSVDLNGFRATGRVDTTEGDLTLTEGVIDRADGALEVEGPGKVDLGQLAVWGRSRVTGAEVDLQDVSLLGGGFAVGGSTLAVDGLTVVDAPEVGFFAEASGVNVWSLVVAGAMGRGVWLRRSIYGLGSLRVTDVVGQPEVSMEHDGSGVWVEASRPKAGLGIERTEVARVEGSGLLVRGGTCRLWEVRVQEVGAGPDRTGAGVACSATQRAALDAVDVRDIAGAGVWIEPSIGLIRDLVVEDAGIGLRVPGSSEVVESELCVQRAALQRIGAVGVCLGQNASAKLHSLSIEMTGGQVPAVDYCVPPAAVEGTAIAVGSQASVAVHWFKLIGGARGVWAHPTAALNLNVGEIADFGVGLEAPSVPDEGLLDVHFQNNGSIRGP